MHVDRRVSEDDETVEGGHRGVGRRPKGFDGNRQGDVQGVDRETRGQEGGREEARGQADAFRTRLAQRRRQSLSLNNLAALYQAQGRYGEAEPLHQRSLAIYEKALGPEHPDVAQSLENYADLLRETGRGAEAAKMEARAKAIRAKSE